MTTQTTSASVTTGDPEHDEHRRTDASGTLGTVGGRAAAMADRAGSVIDRAVADAQPIAAGAADALSDSARAIRQSRDGDLAIGTAMLTGLSIGLVVGGANRLLIAAALVPAGLMGYTLMGRIDAALLRGRRA